MIFVFKTSVKTKMEEKKLRQHSNKLIPNATRNFDLDDSDKILRIDSQEDIVSKIKDLLILHHYSCEELE